jgi:hypothetical protein
MLTQLEVLTQGSLCAGDAWTVAEIVVDGLRA